MVKTYNDPIKKKSREKIKEFVVKNLLKFRKPKDLKVVCFPGAEIGGEEALEIKEVYDPIGIPRSNITGIEADYEKAERLRKADLGINIEQKLDLDFFKETNKGFDIISLDYTGQQTDERMKALGYAICRHLLNKHSILCTNFATKREGDEMKMLLFHRNTRWGLDENRIIYSNEDSEDRLPSLEKVLKEIGRAHV